MTGYEDIWRTEPEGVLAAEIDGLRLVVQASKETNDQVRFLVLRREGSGKPLSIIASGTEESVRAAMQAATRMGERLSGRPLGNNV